MGCGGGYWGCVGGLRGNRRGYEGIWGAFGVWEMGLVGSWGGFGVWGALRAERCLLCPPSALPPPAPASPHPQSRPEQFPDNLETPDGEWGGGPDGGDRWWAGLICLWAGLGGGA